MQLADSCSNSPATLIKDRVTYLESTFGQIEIDTESSLCQTFLSIKFNVRMVMKSVHRLG